ncbi:MAG TPA: hypothetical protein VIX19_16135 [Terriglobales bacterium]
MRIALRVWPALMCMITASTVVYQGVQSPALEPAEIVRRSVEVNTRDWKQLPDYDYFVRERDFGGTKTYLSRMILGSRYNKLVAVNDLPLSPQEAGREKQRYENELSARQKESPERRRERIDKFQKDAERDRFFIAQLGEAFAFTLVKTDHIAGRPVYVLSAKPRHEYRPPNDQAKALTGMQGTLWIDAADFHWVKVHAQVVHPVNIEGFVARIEKGTHFELDQIRITDELWLPSRFLMESHAKVFLIFPHSNKEEETYSGYRKNASAAANATGDQEVSRRQESVYLPPRNR